MMPPESTIWRHYTELLNHGTMRLGIMHRAVTIHGNHMNKTSFISFKVGTRTFVHDEEGFIFGPGDALFVPAHAASRLQN